MNNIVLTIIVPVYNSEKFLPKCVESILNQVFKSFELILINDGSTDLSAKICDFYAKKDKRVKVIHQINSGVSSARNAGLKISKGKYIAFVDSDDWIDSDMYEFLISELNLFDADISICDAYVDFNASNISLVNSIKSRMILSKDDSIKLLLKNKSYKGYLWNKLYLKTLFDGILFDENIHMCEDFLMNIILFSKSKKIVYNQKPKYHYVQNDTNITRKEFSEKYLTGISAMENAHKNIQLLYPMYSYLSMMNLILIQAECCIKISISNNKKYFHLFDALQVTNRKYILKYRPFKEVGLKELLKVLISMLPKKMICIIWNMRLKSERLLRIIDKLQGKIDY